MSEGQCVRIRVDVACAATSVVETDRIGYHSVIQRKNEHLKTVPTKPQHLFNKKIYITYITIEPDIDIYMKAPCVPYLLFQYDSNAIRAQEDIEIQRKTRISESICIADLDYFDGVFFECGRRFFKIIPNVAFDRKERPWHRSVFYEVL